MRLEVVEKVETYIIAGQGNLPVARLHGITLARREAAAQINNEFLGGPQSQSQPTPTTKTVEGRDAAVVAPLSPSLRNDEFFNHFINYPDNKFAVQIAAGWMEEAVHHDAHQQPPEKHERCCARIQSRSFQASSL